MFFLLGNYESNRLIKIIRMLFGAACIAVASFWIYFTINSSSGTLSIWITIIFLTGFGIFQIMAAAGKTDRYISITDDSISLRKYLFLPSTTIPASETESIEFYALKVRFILKSGKTITLRFGTMYYESNEKIVDGLSAFAEKNDVATRIIEEEI